MPDEDSYESAAFERLYKEQSPPVCRFLQVWLGSSSAADDLTQETFLHFWQRRSAFDPKRGNIRAYLFGIARRKAADWYRQNRASAPVLERATESCTGMLIKDVVDQLPEELRSILWLREVEGYSYDELAQIFKIPVGTIRSRLHYARQQLRAIWMKEIR